jgi:hypothetical protein
MIGDPRTDGAGPCAPVPAGGTSPTHSLPEGLT